MYSLLAAFFREQSKKAIVRTENALKGMILHKDPAVCNETAKDQDNVILNASVYFKTYQYQCRAPKFMMAAINVLCGLLNEKK